MGDRPDLLGGRQKRLRRLWIIRLLKVVGIGVLVRRIDVGRHAAVMRCREGCTVYGPPWWEGGTFGSSRNGRLLWLRRLCLLLHLDGLCLLLRLRLRLRLKQTASPSRTARMNGSRRIVRGKVPSSTRCVIGSPPFCGLGRNGRRTQRSQDTAVDGIRRRRLGVSAVVIVLVGPHVDIVSTAPPGICVILICIVGSTFASIWTGICMRLSIGSGRGIGAVLSRKILICDLPLHCHWRTIPKAAR
mmetsp:Transcript_27410/g.56858  ORF Transcript_27410/g.56858 Transcript_27410/m.56858 type:complete len:244 (-) Transcript_27410:531-1262(-)